MYMKYNDHMYFVYGKYCPFNLVSINNHDLMVTMI